MAQLLLHQRCLSPLPQEFLAQRAAVLGFSSSVSLIRIRCPVRSRRFLSKPQLASFSMSRKPIRIAAWASPQPVVQETGQNEEFPSSAAAVAATVKDAASTPVEFSKRTDKEREGFFSGPSAEYVDLCKEQLAICDRLFGHSAKMTVYIRTADSYGTGRLELRRVAAHPKWMMGEPTETLVLICNFDAAVHLHSAEAALSKQEALGVSKFNALVLPMMKDLFLIGVLVAERMIPTSKRLLKHSKIRAVRPEWPPRQMHEVDKQVIDTEECHDLDQLSTFTQEEQGESIKVARTLALACVMDQRTLLLQQSSWQRGVRIGYLLEQIRGPLAAMRTLGKMLQPQLKRGEISSDVLEDILVQGDRMKEVVQEMQEAFYFSQNGSNILSYSEHEMNGRGLLNVDRHRTADSTKLEDARQVLPGNVNAKPDPIQLNSIILAGHLRQGDKEAPLPPTALAPLMHSEIESCDVYKLLVDLIASGAALAHQQGRALELKENPQGTIFLAAVNESSLRQALSNLLESSLQHTLPNGWVKAEVMQAQGGVLVVIDDNGPDLSLMLQTQALAPLGLGLHASAQGRRDARELLSVGAELTVAQNIIEQWGGVLRITSPFLPQAPSGAGGTRLEVWLPAPSVRDLSISHHQSQN